MIAKFDGLEPWHKYKGNCGILRNSQKRVGYLATNFERHGPSFTQQFINVHIIVVAAKSDMSSI